MYSQALKGLTAYRLAARNSILKNRSENQLKSDKQIQYYRLKKRRKFEERCPQTICRRAVKSWHRIL